ncbi:MAG TPA: CBS domain-containing protein [Gemmatimonadales bacterium]|nr:CBS domain-containing protein [Gemmatimonadales bacterium]
MKVAELMVTDLRTVEPDTTVGEALALMTEFNITALPVMDPHRRMIGVISTTDVLEALTEASDADARQQLFEATAVRDLMTPRPTVIPLDTDVKEAAQQMLYLEVRRLFVEDHGVLAGVISQGDIVRGVATAKL